MSRVTAGGCWFWQQAHTLPCHSQSFSRRQHVLHTTNKRTLVLSSNAKVSYAVTHTITCSSLGFHAHTEWKLQWKSTQRVLDCLDVSAARQSCYNMCAEPVCALQHWKSSNDSSYVKAARTHQHMRELQLCRYTSKEKLLSALNAKSIYLKRLQWLQLGSSGNLEPREAPDNNSIKLTSINLQQNHITMI